MKKSLFLFLAAILCSVTFCNAQVQNHQCDHHSCDRHHNVYSADTRAMMAADKMAADLQLTEKEKKEVLEVLKKAELDKDATKAEMEKKKAENDAAIEKIIGKEKMELLKEKRMNNKSQMSRPMNAPYHGDKTKRPMRPDSHK